MFITPTPFRGSNLLLAMAPSFLGISPGSFDDVNFYCGIKDYIALVGRIIIARLEKMFMSVV